MQASEFMQAMVEAGLKRFDATVEPDETTCELREQRNNLRDELDYVGGRVEELENRLYQGERTAVRDYIEENPGATYDEIIQHVVDTVLKRVTKHLDDLEGEGVSVKDDRYYPREDRDGER